MRNTKAKRIRRQARAETVGQPIREYVYQHNAKKHVTHHGTIQLIHDCYRYKYQSLKRN